MVAVSPSTFYSGAQVHGDVVHVSGQLALDKEKAKAGAGAEDMDY